MDSMNTPGFSRYHPDANKYNFDGPTVQHGQTSQTGGHRKWQSDKKVTVSHRVTQWKEKVKEIQKRTPSQRLEKWTEKLKF